MQANAQEAAITKNHITQMLMVSKGARSRCFCCLDPIPLTEGGREKGCKPSGYRPRFEVNLSHCARFVFLSRAID